MRAVLSRARANEARYFKNKYDHVFTGDPASEAADTLEWVHRIFKDERELVIESSPPEATAFQVDGIRRPTSSMRAVCRST